MMTVKKFDKLKQRDFANGACLDEIQSALRHRENLVGLCHELDAELDGVALPATAAAIVNGMRQMIGESEWR